MVFSSPNENLLELLDETGKLGCKPVETHIAQNHKLRESIEDVAADRQSYHMPVGKLIYLSYPKPNITHDVLIVSLSMQFKGHSCLSCYHILQYLKGSGK